MKNDSFIIQGLAGKKSLKGTVIINGAKNAALKAMAAAILFEGQVELRNIPDTEDVHTMVMILEKLGAIVKYSVTTTNLRDTLSIDPIKINSTIIDSKLAGVMRASVVLTGPLMARFGNVTFPTPGGCVIGARPIDQFIKGYEKMGAEVTENDNKYYIEINHHTLGGEVIINFEMKTVGGTETLMMASVLGNGTVTLNNCAAEPEIANVAEWLNQCGADIMGVGTETIVIRGTRGKLLTPKAPYIAIPDRIEAGSYLILGALCASELTVTNCRPDHLKSLIDLLITSGVPIQWESNSNQKDAQMSGDSNNRSITIRGNVRSNSTFKSFNVTTKEYPGFPTDLQAQIVAYLTQVTGASTVTENIFEGRFKYVSDLTKMGAIINTGGPHEVIVNGPSELSELSKNDGNGNNDGLFAHDLRAGFAIVMAALVGKGTFIVNNAYFIDRGYERLEERLTKLGANIRRVSTRGRVS